MSNDKTVARVQEQIKREKLDKNFEPFKIEAENLSKHTQDVLTKMPEQPYDDPMYYIAAFFIIVLFGPFLIEVILFEVIFASSEVNWPIKVWFITASIIVVLAKFTIGAKIGEARVLWKEKRDWHIDYHNSVILELAKKYEADNRYKEWLR